MATKITSVLSVALSLLMAVPTVASAETFGTPQFNPPGSEYRRPPQGHPQGQPQYHHHPGPQYRPAPGPQYHGPRHGRPGYDWDDGDDDAGAAAAAGIIGLAVGAMVAGHRVSRSHVRSCYARYRSYDPDTNTYRGYDGRRHVCR